MEFSSAKVVPIVWDSQIKIREMDDHKSTSGYVSKRWKSY